jgi:hypothetical protein
MKSRAGCAAIISTFIFFALGAIAQNAPPQKVLPPQPQQAAAESDAKSPAKDAKGLPEEPKWTDKVTAGCAIVATIAAVVGVRSIWLLKEQAISICDLLRNLDQERLQLIFDRKTFLIDEELKHYFFSPWNCA